MKFTVDKEIFQLFPGLRIVTVVAKGMGAPTEEEAITRLLMEGWEAAGKAAGEYGNPQSHPNIKPWVDRMKEAGAPRKKYPSSIEAMVKRAGKGGEPFRISPVVDFYNAISMKNVVPAGGFDIDQLEYGLRLGLSAEGDTFIPLDREERISVSPGEVSYVDGSTIITRHFVWKQARHALLTPQSENIFFVSEILGEISEEVVDKVKNGLVQGLKECFGVDGWCQIVNEDHRSVEIK